MAPVLRTRKAAPATEKAAQKPSPATQKKSAPAKRKAAEESSPVSLKKQKSTKPAPSSTKPAGKKAKQVKKAEEEKEKEEEKPAADDNDRIEVSDEDSESGDDGEDDGAKALAAQIDPEDDSGAKGKSLFKRGQDVGKAPTVSAKGKGGDAAASKEEPGVIYIGRIPHGFYEHEMRQYFSQFGPITKLRLSRNKKTGQSKHFAFVEFAEASTADIVAKTMDNYLLFGHILKCKVLPREQVHADLFKGANRRFKKVPWNKMAGKQLEKPLSETEWKGKVAREKTKRADKAEKLKALGYDFEVPDVKDAPPPPPPAPAAVENGGEEGETKAIEAPPPAEADAANGKADDEETEPAPKAKATKSKAKATKGKKAKA